MKAFFRIHRASLHVTRLDPYSVIDTGRAPTVTKNSSRYFTAKEPSRNANAGDDAAWIPPKRPLAGDQGQSHLYVMDAEELNLRRLERELEALEKEEEPVVEDGGDGVDWLQTRRAALRQQGANFMTPNEAYQRRQEMTDLEVKEHTLLTKTEIAQCLDALGGRDIRVILDDPHSPRMGGPLGMIFVTAATATQLRSLADILVRQMRRRLLDEVGVIGAQLGAEGKEDPDSKWLVVDCMNYIVHLQDEETRETLKLEDLWAGKDGLHKLNALDDDDVEDYVAANPVPSNYNPTSVDFDETMRQLQKSRWVAPHKPVVPKKYKGKRRKR